MPCHGKVTGASLPAPETTLWIGIDERLDGDGEVADVVCSPPLSNAEIVRPIQGARYEEVKALGYRGIRDWAEQAASQRGANAATEGAPGPPHLGGGRGSKAGRAPLTWVKRVILCAMWLARLVETPVLALLRWRRVLCVLWAGTRVAKAWGRGAQGLAWQPLDLALACGILVPPAGGAKGLAKSPSAGGAVSAGARRREVQSS
jgi:hypothetical protein